MGKLIGALGAAVMGIALAGVAAWAVFTSQTAAPSSNPAGAQVVPYGAR